MHHSSLNTDRCKSCDGPLETHRERREGFCSQSQCLGPRLQSDAVRAREAEATRRRSSDQFVDEVRDFLAAQPELDSEVLQDSLLVVVPSLEAALVAQPQERVDEFRANLEEAAARAMGHINSEPDREMLRNTFDDDLGEEASGLVVDSCSTCRGACCLQGAGHAFLKSSELARRLVLEPQHTPESLVEDYMSRVPQHAYANSCVFHGEYGCVLPRDIRSSTCNSFICTGIHDAAAKVNDSVHKTTVVAAVNSGHCSRVAQSSPTTGRTECTMDREIR